MEDLSGSYTIGMLLDLDEGTLSVYKNGRKLGVMKGWRANTVGLYLWQWELGLQSNEDQQVEDNGISQ